MIADLTTLHQFKVGFYVVLGIAVALLIIVFVIDYYRWKARQVANDLARRLQMLKHESDVFNMAQADIDQKIAGVSNYVDHLTRFFGER
jgi:hypothetical protein